MKNEILRMLSLPLVLLALPVAAESGGSSLHPQIRFQSSLPNGCSSGWMGRGHGIVGICALQGRVQVRFIDGRILPCRQSNCVDRAAEIEAAIARY